MNDTNFDDPLNPDLLQLFERTGPIESRVEIDQITKPNQAISVFAFTKRSFLMKTSFTLAATTSAVLIWFMFATPNTGGSQAFAQVVENIKKVRSVSFVQRSFSKREKLPRGVFDARFPPGEDAGSTLRKRISETKSMIAEATVFRKRDLQFKLRLLQSIPEGEVNELDDLRWVRIGDKHLQRTDSVYPVGQSHSVINAKTNEHVSFDHPNKLRNVLTKQIVIPRKGRKQTETKIEISPTVDFFKRWQSVPSEATRQETNQQVDGKNVLVFRSTENHESGTWVRTYLVDPATNLPVRIETDFQSAKPGVTSSRWVQEQFVFDAEMNDELFSTKTPAGYESKKAAIYGFGG